MNDDGERQKTCGWVVEELLARRLRLPVVGCRVLYVLRLAGGPEGKMPRAFCWTTPVDERDYVRGEETMQRVHAAEQVEDVWNPRGRVRLWGPPGGWSQQKGLFRILRIRVLIWRRHRHSCVHLETLKLKVVFHRGWEWTPRATQ